MARQLAPDIAQYDEAEHQPWSGYRPMTPDGCPLTGPSGIHGVFLNTGHGMLGWTLSCATAYDLANSVSEQLS